MLALIQLLVPMVVALSIAVLAYVYGSPALRQGLASVEATQILNDAQHIELMSQLYHVRTGNWPVTLMSLVDEGYLQHAPGGGMLPEEEMLLYHLQTQAVVDTVLSHAAWTQPLPGVPVYVYSVVWDDVACGRINQRLRGDDGILKPILSSQAIQCVGRPATGYAVLVNGAGPEAWAAYADSVGLELTDEVPDSLTSPNWSSPPANSTETPNFEVAGPAPSAPTPPAPPASAPAP